MNLPNQLTIFRLFLSIIYFVLLTFMPEQGHMRMDLLHIALGIFVIAIVTDFLDGYLARRYQMVTNFGRIADPFVDKVLICGSFVFLTSWEQMNNFLPAWMVVVILSREFIISAIRTYAEASNIPFGSSQWGQHKTTVQSATIIWILIYLGYFDGTNTLWAMVILGALIWLTLVTTVVSGVSYLFKYRRLRQALP